MGMDNVPPKLHRGLKAWAKSKPTKEIAEHLEGKVDDPQAVAVAVRKDAIGERAFRQHQREARTGRGACGR